MKILFLDLDGVVNSHRPHHGSPYNGIEPSCMAHLNRILQTTDTNIILSSAWRYQILCGSTTIRGMEFLLYSHGLIPRGNHAPWLVGHTPSDEAIGGRDEAGRVAQILASLYSLLPRKIEAWCVLDDLPLEFPDEHRHRFVKTDGDTGLTEENAEMVIDLLLGKE